MSYDDDWMRRDEEESGWRKGESGQGKVSWWTVIFLIILICVPVILLALTKYSR